MNLTTFAQKYIVVWPESALSLRNLAFPILVTVIFIGAVTWVLRKSAKMSNATLSALELTKDSIRVMQDGIEVARQTNRLLTELNENLKNQSKAGSNSPDPDMT